MTCFYPCKFKILTHIKEKTCILFIAIECLLLSFLIYSFNGFMYLQHRFINYWNNYQFYTCTVVQENKPESCSQLILNIQGYSVNYLLTWFSLCWRNFLPNSDHRHRLLKWFLEALKNLRQVSAVSKSDTTFCTFSSFLFFFGISLLSSSQGAGAFSKYFKAYLENSQ